MELPYEKVSNISIYNHTIELEKEVVKFKITALAGDAQLIYNHNDMHVRGIVKSPDHEHKEIELMHGSFYLVTHRRPIERKNVD